jgi:hypothetical protein
LHSSKVMTPIVFGKYICLGLEYSDWVLQRVMEIYRVVGLSCEGYEEQFMALLTAIELGHCHKDLASSSKFVNKGNKEIKRLACSMNYDSKCGSSSHGKGKGRGFSIINEA